MSGKSQAAIIIAKAKCEIDPSTKIGVTCKSTYKRLISQGVPEENLIKCWEKAILNINPDGSGIWFDEYLKQEG